MKTLITTISILAIAGCGAETGNGATLKILLTSTAPNGLSPTANPSPVGTDAQGSRLTISSARVNTRKIELQSPGSKLCVDADYAMSGFTVHCDSDKFRLEDNVVFDLLSGVSTPSLTELLVPAGVYKKASVRLDDAKSEDGRLPSGDPLVGHTLIAAGTIRHQGQDKPFDLLLDFNEDVGFEDAGGISVSATGAQDLLLLLDVGLWFSAIPLTTCLDQGELDVENGRIQIKDKSGGCSAIESAIKSAIKGSSKISKK